MNTQTSTPPSGGGNKPKKLTLARIKQIEKILERADTEIDGIIQEYYLTPGGQNVAGTIGQISRLHAQLVEQLAEKKREMLKEASTNKRVRKTVKRT